VFIVRACAGTIVALLASQGGAFAGAWLLDAGKGEGSLTATFSSAIREFNGSGKLEPAARYSKFELQGLLEYGVTPWLTGILSPGFQHVDIAAPTSATRSGPGYTELGGRALIAQGTTWVISGQATMRIPGTFDTSNPAAIGYTGVEVDIRALAGKSFSAGNWPAFVDLQLAQRFRGGGPPDEFRADLTFGVRPVPAWLLLAQSFNVISEGDGGPLFPSYNYHKLQLSAVYDVTPQWALQLGGYTTFAGRNALQENGLMVGAWYKF
jgi:hypothetical protein